VAYLWEPVDRVEDVPELIKNMHWGKGSGMNTPSASEVFDDEGNPIGALYSKCGNATIFITRNVREVFIEACPYERRKRERERES
jgi:hypothetical protein